MSLFQKIIILLNFKPLTSLFRAIYAFGLQRLVTALAQQPAVHSVYGTGSFFYGKCLFGLSDIDLVIVISERFSRTDPEPYQIPRVYERIRRIFPFLGNWSEKAESLIFLSEVRRGFPLLESFRLLWKTGQLHRLTGDPFPGQFVQGPLTTSEVISEINTLLRITMTKGEVHSSNLLFWKKVFFKFISLIRMMNLPTVADEIRRHEKLWFLDGSDLLLFIRKSKPNDLFPLLLDFVHTVFSEFMKRETSIRVALNPIRRDTKEFAASGDAKRALDGSGAFREIAEMQNVVATSKPFSPLFGILPRLNYFPMERPLAIFEVVKKDYETVRRIIKILYETGEPAEGCLLRVGELFFILSRMQSHVEVVPLDPIIFANAYEQLIEGNGHFRMPREVYVELKTGAERMFAGFAGIYRSHEGWIPKLPFPCIYSEDDLVVLQDAFHRMRAYLAYTDAVDLESPAALLEYLAARFPNCRDLLHELLRYYRYLSGRDGEQIPANNLYRCLHQFMAQLLSGASVIGVDSHHRRLGLTVGIITRNRSADLKEALYSLTQQTRPADEVLIVDNGSTDRTRAVVESFRRDLPIAYHYLKEMSIPKARNMVIERASHEIIAFTDDDCILDPNWLRAVEKGFLRAENIGMVGGWVKHAPAAHTSIIDTYYSVFHHNTT